MFTKLAAQVVAICLCFVTAGCGGGGGGGGSNTSNSSSGGNGGRSIDGSSGSSGNDQSFQPAPGPTDLDQPADGPPRAAAPSLSGLVDLVAAAPEGSWVRANLNSFSEVFTPPDLRPYISPSNVGWPGSLIAAWSSFAWDPNRGDLWIFGGGHANYAGNEVYRWRGSTRRWERASVPSEWAYDALGNHRSVDGPDAAPTAAHTYDNNMFLPIVDRFLTFGGAALNGNMWLRQASATTSRPTGPYFFDPNRADANKVGGTTGSHVKRVAPHPEIVGGNMWNNRDIFVNVPGNPPFPNSGSFLEGCTAYDQQNGKDVVYVKAGPRLYKYTINDVANPAADTWQLVGREPYALAPLGYQPACGYDPVSKLFVRRGVRGTPPEEPLAQIPFTYWDLNTPGETNIEVRVYPSDPSGEFTAFTNQPLPTHITSNHDWLGTCGMDFDPVRRKWMLWCGSAVVWMLSPPATISPNGWVITKQPNPVGAVPDGDYGTGINGKWKYIPNLDVFMGLINAAEGNVWIYKPFGWRSPGTASATLSASPQSIAAGGSVTVSWNNIASATSSNWIGLHSQGAPWQQYLAWMYVSCTQSQGAPRPNGSCNLTVPNNLAPGTYELRLYGAPAWTAIATTTLTVTGGSGGGSTTFNVTQSSVAPGGSVNVSWSSIAAPASNNWIGLHTPGTSWQSYLAWAWVSCTQTQSTARPSGNCDFAIPSSLASGTYELRLYGAPSWTPIAPVAPLTVANASAGGATLTAAPSSIAAGGNVTASWNTIASPTALDWIGLYQIGASSQQYQAWTYVSCTQTAGTARPGGTCGFAIPNGLASGSYEMRLHANNGYTLLTKSNVLTIP